MFEPELWWQTIIFLWLIMGQWISPWKYHFETVQKKLQGQIEKNNHTSVWSVFCHKKKKITNLQWCFLLAILNSFSHILQSAASESFSQPPAGLHSSWLINWLQLKAMSHHNRKKTCSYYGQLLIRNHQNLLDPVIVSHKIPMIMNKCINLHVPFLKQNFPNLSYKSR